MAEKKTRKKEVKEWNQELVLLLMLLLWSRSEIEGIWIADEKAGPLLE